MSISIGYINTLMTNTISDGHGGEPHIDQQTDVAVSDSVDSYSFDTTGGTTTANFMVEVRFREREDAVIFGDL